MSKAKMKRKDKYPPNGAAPQSNRTPEEQLKWLDQKGFVATKERARLTDKILAAAAKKVVANVPKVNPETDVVMVDPKTAKKYDRWARNHPAKQSDVKTLQNKVTKGETK